MGRDTPRCAEIRRDAAGGCTSTRTGPRAVAMISECIAPSVMSSASSTAVTYATMPRSSGSSASTLCNRIPW